ncbi:MAG: hypothetical protein KGI02_08890 [Thaumarchaeota archaeon]|nr:hypothetical protein [Nitrososphaerota archaeon]MDE1878654.1 hypothetical protein [Nitrososphaerota archaeon]
MKIQNNKTKAYLVVGLSLVVMLASSSSLGAVFAQVTTPNANLNQRLQIEKDKIGQLIPSQDVSTHAATISEHGGIPVVLTYVDGRTSELVVGISDKSPLSKDIYEKRLRTIVGDVPMRIEFGHVQLLSSCTGVNVPCNPMVGGNNVNPQSGGGSTTLSLMTTNTAGTQGFIMAAHGVAAGLPCSGHIGDTIMQEGNIAGKVWTNPSSNRHSDSAFIQLWFQQTFTPNQIYRGVNQVYTVTQKVASNPNQYQMPVYMESINGFKQGNVVSSGAVISQSSSCGTLKYVAVNISGQGGDSGAPIFSPPDGNNNVSFYGIAVAQWTGDPQHVLLYSPWESIQADLNVN